MFEEEIMRPADHRRPIMTLYAKSDALSTHWIQFVLAEKEVEPNLVYVNPKALPVDLVRINPNGLLPFLVDRDLVLYKTHIINEYLEERFPHPPLLPVYPIIRAKCRQMIYQIETNWYTLINNMNFNKDADKNYQILKKGLASLTALFTAKTYFLEDEFSLVDCCIAPVLWRLKQLNLDTTFYPQTILDYQENLFARSGFKESLAKMENENTHG